uniref:Uncharacterized protein n=1 Tax=Eutreptiella gymnastica TaxID=73025 RepID=A0A7S4D1W0_9EUGL|mmetsp:Transcript_50359/g.84242  ORF Transcript_50359/g.84242 Transcript_50359/m.84242 type:complete len:142 (-) Transcript_50359:68-493(-)|eukprot:CAMPEP_0174310216 /NCGR_PEP_ID=MMETSP0810-20121108/2904_1 /TAXON_ID=73025 ORGANISM="Eutreptiella gymnastica-like, Strain CCMP1594" /NCGR_SAMPLE_ID=MMETSP0810 /ASSEMBLY_ACC=CAM_ASM_000659 /LENGTH=141 /DNA_ID=CAMNT_0015418059 /DNA_START=70 /DNA_END=495 /DNA_ORIENTATION=-
MTSPHMGIVRYRLREQLIATEEKYRSAIELEEDKERAAAREQERPLRDDAGVRFQQRTHSETLAKEAKEQLKDHRIAGTFEQHTAKCEGTMRKFADDAEPWHVRLRRESIEAQEAELAALEKRYSNLEASCLSTALNATGR